MLPDVLPTVLEPTSQELKELADSLFSGRLPEELPLVANWSPLALPPGYVHAIKLVDTKVSPNMGELMMHYCMWAKLPTKVQNPGGVPWYFRLQEVSRPFLRDVIRRYGDDMIQTLNPPHVLMMNCNKDLSLSLLRGILDEICATNALALWPLDKVEPGSIKTHADLINSQKLQRNDSPKGTIRILEERG